MTTFNGFEPANTTPVPDTLFDVLLSKLSGAELKVMLYIIRRTLGFKKTNDTISFTQFEKGIITSEGKILDEGTGLSRETISKALQTLEEKGCIKSDKGYTPQKDKDITLYSIRFSGDEGVVGKSDHVGSRKNGLPVVGKTDYGSRIIPEGVVGKSDLQDTVLQDTVKQETVLQEREGVADATAHSQSSSQETMFSDDDTEKKEVVHGSPDTHIHPIMDNHPPADSHQSSSPPRTDNMVTEPTATRKRAANKRTIPKHITQQGLMDEIPKPIPPEAIAIMDRWDSNHTKPSPRGEKTIKAAILLIPFNPTKEELKACEEWLFTTDRPGKPWYRSHGVHLPDIAEKIGSWQSLQNAPPPKPEKEESNEHKASNFYSLDAFIERQNKWKSEGATL